MYQFRNWLAFLVLTLKQVYFLKNMKILNFFSFVFFFVKKKNKIKILLKTATLDVLEELLRLGMQAKFIVVEWVPHKV